MRDEAGTVLVRMSLSLVVDEGDVDHQDPWLGHGEGIAGRGEERGAE